MVNVAFLTRVLNSVALLALGGLAVGGGAVALEMTGSQVEPGDRVTYHVYAYRATDDVLVYTTDFERARDEVEAGNTALPLLPADKYGAPTRDVVLTDGTLDPVRAVLGYHVGSVAKTAAIHTPFGISANLPTWTFPRVLGPLPLEFRIELDKVYEDGSKSWFKEAVPRETLVPGARIPYIGGSEAVVIDVRESTARLRLVLDEKTPEVIRSRNLDIPLRIEAVSTDAILLHVDLKEGETFQTRGCSNHGIVLPKGTYTVEDVTDGDITVRAHPGPDLAPVLDQDLRFEFRVIALEKWPQAKASATLAALGSIWQRNLSSEHHEE